MLLNDLCYQTVAASVIVAIGAGWMSGTVMLNSDWRHDKVSILSLQVWFKPGSCQGHSKTLVSLVDPLCCQKSQSYSLPSPPSPFWIVIWTCLISYRHLWAQVWWSHNQCLQSNSCRFANLSSFLLRNTQTGTKRIYIDWFISVKSNSFSPTSCWKASIALTSSLSTELDEAGSYCSRAVRKGFLMASKSVLKAMMVPAKARPSMRKRNKEYWKVETTSDLMLKDVYRMKTLPSPEGICFPSWHRNTQSLPRKPQWWKQPKGWLPRWCRQARWHQPSSKVPKSSEYPPRPRSIAQCMSGITAVNINSTYNYTRWNNLWCTHTYHDVGDEEKRLFTSPEEGAHN